MIDSIELINMVTQESITIDAYDSDYILDKIDWDVVSATHNTYEFPEQVGSYLFSTKLQERDISIEGYLIGDVGIEDSKSMTIAQYLEAQSLLIKHKQNVLNLFINPKHQIKIKVGTFYLLGNPLSSIKYSTNEQDNNEVCCRFMIDIRCFSPMFNAEEETLTVLSGIEPKFKFPLIIPKNDGIIFGIKTEYALVAINNQGSIDTGSKIILMARGTITNPRIENIHTREYIELNRKMVKDELIIINTENGQRSIKGYINGVERDYLKYWVSGSSWIQFPVGYSLLGYSQNKGELADLLNVSILMQQRFFSLEGQ